MDTDPPLKITITPKATNNKGTVYSVSFNGVEIIAKTSNPELNACRWLVAQGYRGRMEVWDMIRPYPRMTFNDIEKAAGLTVLESDKQPLRFAQYRPMSDERKDRLAGHGLNTASVPLGQTA